MRPEPTIGDVFGGYRIDGVAGRGGMGTVYRATELALDRLIALKVIAAGLAEDVSFRKRFMRESRTAAGLDHPNIVPVFRAGEDDGLLFIAMRFVEGVDLRALIAREGRLDPVRAASIIAQIGDALDCAHEHGLVHRDVKPGNVLLTGASGREHAYLSDFGLTKHTTSVGGITETGQWVGTLDYVAPEQIRGERADARADVYSLGAVLYQALTGSVPFPMMNDAAKLYAHLATDPPSCIAREGVPDEFDAVVTRALAKNPDDRYLSAGDLGRAALAAAQRRDVAAPERSLARGAAAPGPGEPPTPLPSPVPEAASSTRVAPAPTVIETPTTTAPRPARAPSSRRRAPVAAAVAAVLATAAVVVIAIVVFGGGGGSGGGAQAESIPLGSPAADVAAGAGGAWAALPRKGSVARVDAAKQAVAARIPVPDRPFVAAADGSDAWVAAELSGRITHVAAAGKVMAPRVRLGGNVYDLAVGSHRLWVTQQTGPGPLTTQPTVVSRVDATTGRTSAPDVPIGKGPSAVAVSQGSVWAANARSGNVYRIDPATGRQLGAPTHAGRTATAIAAGPEGVWIVDGESGVANQLDPAGRGVVKTVKVGGRPAGVAVGGGSIWVVDRAGNRLVQIDAKSGSVKRRIDVGPQPTAVSFGGGAAWVASSTTPALARVTP